MELAVQMKGITKYFPGVLANDHVDLEVRRGEILALVGENGAGKSTLMNILYGLHTPDAGGIWINGQPAAYTNTLGAIEQGIGMVHQHFMLIPRLGVAENIVLGSEPGKPLRFVAAQVEESVAPLLARFGLDVSPGTLVSQLSLGTQQKVEIVKALYRKANILIMDEPTAVLTPQEINELGVILRQLKEQGMSIIIITHKLQEVKDFSDRITVMRRGKNVGTVITAETAVEDIVRMMVGRSVELDSFEKAETRSGKKLLEIKDLSYFVKGRAVLQDINLDVRAGEILGIAGIDGSGQNELSELINGMVRQTGGEIVFDGRPVDHLNPMKRRRLGMGFIPQDRQKYGLVLDFTIEENLVLGFERKPEFSRHGMIAAKSRKQNANTYIREFDIRTPSEMALARNLSGGNQQKVIIAREMSMHPSLVVANQPTRGVDIGAIEFIHKTLVDARNSGKGVLLVSLELDELLSLSDRIAVMYSGRVVGILQAANATREQIGFMMVGQQPGGQDGEGRETGDARA